jgi:hypothetical protein
MTWETLVNLLSHLQELTLYKITLTLISYTLDQLDSIKYNTTEQPSKYHPSLYQSLGWWVTTCWIPNISSTILKFYATGPCCPSSLQGVLCGGVASCPPSFTCCCNFPITPILYQNHRPFYYLRNPIMHTGGCAQTGFRYKQWLVEARTTRGATALAYCLINSSLDTDTVQQVVEYTQLVRRSPGV